MEDFVPYKLAVKLEEKGFPQDIQYCIGWYPTEYYKNSCIGEYFEGELQEIEDYFGDRISAIHIIENKKKGVIAPTISQVLKWLRRKYAIHIEIALGKNGWYFEIVQYEYYEEENEYDCKLISISVIYDSYELAALAGIEYCLDNLI